MPPLPYRHLPELFRAMTAEHGRNPAYSICLPNGASATLSFEQMDLQSDAFAAYLRETLKLQAGDRVGIQLPNCLAYAVAAFGILKAGCVLVNCNPLYTPAELEHQLQDAGATVLVSIDLFADKLATLKANTPVQHVVLAKLTEFFPFFEAAVIGIVLKYVRKQIPPCPVAVTPFAKAMAEGRAQAAKAPAYAAALTPDSLAALQYTGGTTGVSKGAMLSHKNLLSNVEQAYQFCKHRITQGQEVVLAPLPLYHVFSFTVNLLTFFRTGAHGILVPNPRPISNLKAVFKKYPLTWMTGINTLYAALLSEKWFKAAPPQDLKVAIAGGAALQGAVSERWRVLIGDPVTEGYGLTESSPVVCFNPLGEGRAGYIGVPLPGIDIKLIKEDGSEAAPGEAGELCVQGTQVMQGYWKRPEESAQVLVDGWLHTGDVAVLEADGFVKIVDRLKDMIVVSGFKVFPNEVEDCLAHLEGVAECAVIGVPSGDSGEAVKAFIVTRPGVTLSIEQVREHCKKSLTNYKVPKFVEFRADLPKTNVGKILRKDLRKEELAKQAAI
jgi:long-chain acyl-CoA synthetase